MPDVVPFELSYKSAQNLAKLYGQTAKEIARRLGLAPSDVHISRHALSLALGEAAKDLKIMQIRRQPKSGINPAKIAGVLTFRLSRFSPIQVSGAALENDIALKLNTLSAFALSLKAFMKMDITDIRSEHVTRELQYTLARRHTNQETLGLVFDMLVQNTGAT